MSKSSKTGELDVQLPQAITIIGSHDGAMTKPSCHGLTPDTASGTKGKKICAAPVIGNCLSEAKMAQYSRTVQHHRIASKGRRQIHSTNALKLEGEGSGCMMGCKDMQILPLQLRCLADVPDTACCHFAGFYRCIASRNSKL